MARKDCIMTTTRAWITLATLALATLTLAPLSAPRVAADDPTPTPVAAVPATPVPVATQYPGYPYPPGIPAIPPEPQRRAQALANTAAYSTTATYTADDVRAYLATPPPFRTTDGSPITVTAILFIPASQASALMAGESTGRPDTTLVCYVTVTGSLVMVHSLPPHIRRKQTPPSTPRHTRTHTPSKLPVGHLVFDAQTGNLLLFGYYY